MKVKIQFYLFPIVFLLSFFFFLKTREGEEKERKITSQKQEQVHKIKENFKKKTHFPGNDLPHYELPDGHPPVDLPDPSVHQKIFLLPGEPIRNTGPSSLQ